MVFRRLVVSVVRRALRLTGAARLQATIAESTRKTMDDVRIILILVAAVET